MQDSRKQGKLIVLSGPSGVGKGTLCKRLRTAMGETLQISVSATTRPKRSQEQDGTDYFFLTPPEFEQWIQAGYLLEWAEFAGNYYGTPRVSVENALKKGISVLLEIEVKGALQIKTSFSEALLIFIAPPDFAVLEARLRSRGTNDEDDINRRLAIARWEMTQTPLFENIFVNTHIDETTAALLAFLESAC
jgi:guanylate kinase